MKQKEMQWTSRDKLKKKKSETEEIRKNGDEIQQTSVHIETATIGDGPGAARQIKQ